MEGIVTDTVTELSLYSATVGNANPDGTTTFRRCIRPDGVRCGAGDPALGIARFASSIRGELMTVDTDGLVLAEAGAAIALGPGGMTLVKPGADGRLVAVGNLDPDPPVGAVFQAVAAAGDVAPVLLMRADPRHTMQIEHTDNNEVLNRFVTAAGARCASGHQQIGASLTESDSSGEQLRVQVYGIAMVLSGAAIALAQGSQKVESDAQGRAIMHAGSEPVAGLALAAAGAANVLTPVLLGAF